MHLIRVRSTLRFLPLILAVGCRDSVTPGPPPAGISITGQPSTAETGKAMQPGVEVVIRDKRGIVLSAGTPVSLALAAPSGGATLIGTTTVRTRGGVATFDDIGVDLAGTGYTILVTAGAVTATTDPFSVTPAAPFVSVSTGETRSCGLTAPGAAYCWGVLRWPVVEYRERPRPAISMQQRATPEGWISLESTAPEVFIAKQTLPSRVPATSVFTLVESGGMHSCALAPSGAAYCWGTNLFGELGHGTLVDKDDPTPVAGGFRFVSLTAGASHTCGLTAAGAAYCWGENNGQLGDGTRVDRVSPVPVHGGLAFTSLDVGSGFTCGLANGVAYCWGANYSAQLGDGTQTARLTPTRVASDVNFTSVTAGVAHACALTAIGAAYCWGEAYGGVGDGSLTRRLAPVPVATEIRFIALTAGGFHSCGVTAAGAAYCWGNNTNGAVGDGTGITRLTPVRVAGETSFSRLRAGFAQTCGLVTGGGAVCWGDNTFRQLGDGTETRRFAPSAVR